MLSRRHRFHGYGSVRRVYSHSRPVRGSIINLRFADRPAGKPYRVAVIVSRRVNKSAVKRNRIRRRVFEAVRHSSYLPGSTDLIFSVHNDSVADMPADQLDQSIDDLLKKIKHPTA